MAAEAQAIWRKAGPGRIDGRGAGDSIFAGVGSEGRYSECGLVLVATDGDGQEYVRKSYENMKEEKDEKLIYLPDEAAIRQRMGTGGCTGKQGYCNERSGWADAEAAMRWVRRKCEKYSNIPFITAKVTKLWTNGEVVRGVVLEDGRELKADLTVIASGAWSASLINLQGRAISTGQVIGYIKVTAEEEQRYKDIPVTLNLSHGRTGLFTSYTILGHVADCKHVYL